jgi:hypothetical protein
MSDLTSENLDGFAVFLRYDCTENVGKRRVFTDINNIRTGQQLTLPLANLDIAF